MTKKLLDWDQGAGKAVYWHEHGDGDWAQEIVQDVTPLLDRNKVFQNHGDMRWQGSEHGIKHVATIPLVVIAKWREMYGFDYFDPDPAVQRKVDDLLNSNEWRYLRTDNSVL